VTASRTPGTLAAGAVRRLRRQAVRATRHPFTGRGPHPVIVHCTHHKCGTVWFANVLLGVSRHYGLNFRIGTNRSAAAVHVPADAEVVFYQPAHHFSPQEFGRPVRGSHVIRDPRDMIVSGYEYHLRTDEAWAHEPDPRWGGGTYQALLRSLDEDDGLRLEIEWQADGVLQELTAWDYGQPDFLELRFEEVLADEHAAFDRLFRWYGLTDDAVAVGHRVVDQLTLAKGGAKPGHARGGSPSEWQDRLTGAHLEFLRERTDDVVGRLGYDG